MSVIVRVSYQNDDELKAIREALKDMLPVCQIASSNGLYKRAYLKQRNKPVRKQV